jgi:nucleotide-binding universal stress UspA family protein
MTIVCATDFSQPAADAIDVAADIARKRGESLLLWHAVEPQAGDPVSAYVEPVRADRASRLEREAERIRGLGVVVECSAVIGWPEDELPARMPAETTLLVIGARGHRGGAHWLVGSVVERLARVVSVPMLVVRDAAALRTWLDGTRRLNVVIASDLSAVSDFALRRANILRKLGPCDVELLFVEYPPVEYARLGVTGQICVHRPHPLIHEVLTRELVERAETINLGGEVTTRIGKTLGMTGPVIALEAEKVHGDLIIVGSHQRKAIARAWYESVANGVLHSSETNVLLIPFHAADEDFRALEQPRLTTIIAATDFSPCGNHAVSWACAMARPETHVVILNVADNESAAAEASHEAEQIKATTVSGTSAGRVDTVVTVGKDIAATISAMAERLSADVVIVGRHTRSRVAHALAGSVSGEVLARSRRPVLVVPDPATI